MRCLFNLPLLNIAKQHRGISLGAVAVMGPGAFFLLTSVPAVLPHVGFAHVDLGRVEHDHRRGR